MDLSPTKWCVACWMVDDKISMHKIIFLPIVISFHWEQSVMPPSPDVRARDTFQLFKWVLPFKGFLCKCCCSTKERKKDVDNISIKSNMKSPELNNPDPIVVCFNVLRISTINILLLLAHMMNTSPESEWSDNSGIWLEFTSCYVILRRSEWVRPDQSGSLSLWYLWYGDITRITAL